MEDISSRIEGKSRNTPENPGFEKLYIRLREKENRLYSDEEVIKLPAIDVTHPHYKEWLQRKKSSDRLIKYLNLKDKPLDILEIGCGNGWLSARLAANPLWNVIGNDINAVELDQAERLFGHLSNLKFNYGDLLYGQEIRSSYDIIVFAASIQYFPFFKEVINSSIQVLKPGGEIHIIDTVFYQKQDIAAAKQRTAEYYSSIGFPEAVSHYFHHSIEELQNFNTEILYNPTTWMHRLSKNKSPFYWICINKLIKNKGNEEL